MEIIILHRTLHDKQFLFNWHTFGNFYTLLTNKVLSVGYIIQRLERGHETKANYSNYFFTKGQAGFNNK